MIQHWVGDLNIERRRDAVLQLEVVEPIVIDVRRIEQLTLRVVQRLASQIDLKPIDPPGIVSGLQLLQAVAKGGNVGKLISNDLRRLQQTDVTACRLSTGAACKSKTLYKLCAAGSAN